MSNTNFESETTETRKDNVDDCQSEATQNNNGNSICFNSDKSLEESEIDNDNVEDSKSETTICNFNMSISKMPQLNEETVGDLSSSSPPTQVESQRAQTEETTICNSSTSISETSQFDAEAAGDQSSSYPPTQDENQRAQTEEATICNSSTSISETSQFDAEAAGNRSSGSSADDAIQQEETDVSLDIPCESLLRQPERPKPQKTEHKKNPKHTAMCLSHQPIHETDSSNEDVNIGAENTRAQSTSTGKNENEAMMMKEMRLRLRQRRATVHELRMKFEGIGKKGDF